MEGLRFEWDEAKSLSNRRKHGVTFEEAGAVFRDPLYVSVEDRIEDGELRWLTLGLADGLILLAVAHTVREERDQSTSVEIIRIISARQATRKERRRYEDENS
ncbi:MAG: BrnT family toxin [Candidatus Sulfotelmatobacter sp.]